MSHQPGTTQGAGQSVDDGKGRIFPCEQCGADFEFHIGQQSLQCPYCGFTKQLDVADAATVSEHDYAAMLGRIADRRRQGVQEETTTQEIRCESCGANVVFEGTLTSSECVCCGSPIQRDNVHTAADRVPVDGVLSFRVPNERAAENLKRWVQSRWFAPSEFRQRGVQGRFNGVYLPYWTYDSMTANWFRGQRGEHYWVETGSGDSKRRERRTRWYPVAGAFQRFFDDVMVCAAVGLPKWLIESLEPWPLDESIPFTQQVLAGFFAQTYATPLDQGFVQAKQRIDRVIEQDVRHRIGGDEQQVDAITTRHEAVTFKHLLLPVWLLAYRFESKTYQVAINACTGEVQGERPYSWVKITLTALTAGALAAAAYFLTTRG